MNSESIFSFANGFAAASWLIMIGMYNHRRVVHFIGGVSILFLAILYVLLIVPGMGSMDFSSFGSLQGVSDLFSVPAAVLAGWVHYLAFDLFAGLSILHSARLNGFNRWILLPVFLFTFMLGPSGFLLYWVILCMKQKRFFPDLFPTQGAA